MKSSSPAPTFRRDIEGLRGFAVAVVVADHLMGRPSGGFVGVDVFFVVSGFVITAVLLRELGRTGTISLTAFYARRVRRIVPAAVVVIAATLVTASLLWFAPRFWATVLDAVASLTFVQNWHLVAVGTDYLAADAPPGPLQHFWSLAVEEQFYLVWPVVLLVAAGVAARSSSPRARQVVVTAALSAVLVLSIGYAVWRGDHSPSAAYFDSIARTWELAAGGLCAVAVPLVRRMAPGLRQVVVLAGQAAIVFSLVLVDPDSSFPWPWALLPVAGTSAVVLAGSGGLGRVEAALVARPARWLGRRSYSLYLWHFPVVVFAASLGLDEGWWLVAQVGLMLGLSALSFRFVESTVQHSGWLRSWELPVEGGARGARLSALARQIVVVGVVTTVVVGMSAAQSRGPAALRDPALARASVGWEPAGAGQGVGTDDEAVPSWTPRSLGDAVAEASRRPERAPGAALDTAFSTSLVSQLARSECRYDVGTDRAAAVPCEAGDPAGPRTAVIVGDSIALSWLPAIEAALGDGWRIRALAFGSCSTVEASYHYGDPEAPFAEKCAVSRADLSAFVESSHADLVVTSSSVSGLGRLLSGATGADAVSEWRDGTRDAVTTLAHGGARVLVLGAPPRGASPAVCATRPTGAAACVTDVEGVSLDARTAEVAGVGDARRLGVDASFVDVSSWFCDADGRCPVTAGDILIRADEQHVTEVMSRSLGELVRAELSRVGVVEG